MVEEQSLSIDSYHRATRDKAYYNGRYYSDKAPGMSFAAYPCVAAATFGLKSLSSHIGWVKQQGGKIIWIDSKGEITEPYRFVNQFVTIATSGLIGVLTALAIYFVAIRLGASLGGAVFGSLAYGLATPAWGWATAFFGHASAGGCLFLGFAGVFLLLHCTPGTRKEILLSFASGALLAWAVVIEYTSAPASLIIALYGIYNARTWQRGRLLIVFLSAFAGALIFITPLLIYNYEILGRVYGSLYKYNVLYPNMSEGFYGLTYLDFDVLIKLLFSGRYGILWFSPLLIAVPPALITLWRYPEHRSLVITLTVIPLYYLLWNSSYLNWTGGGSTVPRFLTPMLPFLCLPLSVLWTRAGKKIRVVLLILFTISMLISLMSAAVSMTQGQYSDSNIVMDYLVPEFMHGRIPQLSLPVKLIFSDPTITGYNGQLALIPLYLIIAVCVVYIIREVRKDDQIS